MSSNSATSNSTAIVVLSYSVKCEDAGRNQAATKDRVYFINDKNNLSSLNFKNSPGESISNLNYEEHKEISNLAEFVVQGKYAYCISEDGVFRKYNPRTKKLRSVRYLKKSSDPNIFTSICLTDNKCVAVASVHPECEAVSLCVITLLANWLEPSDSLELETKSFKLNSRASSSNYDVNPIHQMSQLKARGFTLLLAVNWGSTMHILGIIDKRLHLVESKQVNNRFNGMICGIRTKDNCAYIFGWKQFLKRIIL